MNGRRTIQLFLIAFLTFAFCGCVRREATSTGITVTYETWVGIVGVLVGVVATFFSWFATGWRGKLFFAVCLIGTITFSPFGFIDHVTITDSQMNTQWGFWVFPTKHEVKFDDVESVALTKSVSRGRRGRKNTNYNFEFRMSDGHVEKLSATNTLMEEAIETLVEQLGVRGIEVADQTGD